MFAPTLKFGLIYLHDGGRAAPVGTDGRMIDVGAIVDLEHRRLRQVVAPQVKVDFDLTALVKSSGGVRRPSGTLNQREAPCTTSRR